MLKHLLVTGTDIAVCVIAVLVSFSIRLGYWQLARPVWVFAGVEIAIFLSLFVSAGVYKNVFRFNGPKGLAQLAKVCLLLAGPTVLLFGIMGAKGIPRTVSVLFPILFFVFLATARVLARFVLVDLLAAPAERQAAYIYGTGPAARQLAGSLAHDPSYRLTGYLAEDPEMSGRSIEGIPIHPGHDLEVLGTNNRIGILFLAIPQASRSANAAVIRRAQALGVHVQTLPALHDIVEGKVSVSDLREISVTDLLSRSPVNPDVDLMQAAIHGKTVLVTGAGGSIGSELCRQILRQGPARLILAEMSEAALFTIDLELGELAAKSGTPVTIVTELGSIENAATTQRLFERWRPHTAFHAAAYKHVPMVEANVIAGVRNNVFGTFNAARAALAVGTERFILISTDKAVRPTNIMGASKRVCESILQALADVGPTRFAMVRFGNVLGSSGSVVPKFERQIADGGPVTITHRDVTRFFMTIPEAAELVIQAGTMARGGEVYLLDMGEPVKIFELARAMIQLAGRSVRDANNPEGDIEIVEVGLRPGEKLFEELLIGASAEPTDHERIMRAVEHCLSWDELEPALARLHDLLDAGDSQAVRAMLHQLVPDFAESPSTPPQVTAPEGEERRLPDA